MKSMLITILLVSSFYSNAGVLVNENNTTRERIYKRCVDDDCSITEIVYQNEYGHISSRAIYVIANPEDYKRLVKSACRTGAGRYLLEGVTSSGLFIINAKEAFAEGDFLEGCQLSLLSISLTPFIAAFALPDAAARAFEVFVHNIRTKRALRFLINEPENKVLAIDDMLFLNIRNNIHNYDI